MTYHVLENTVSFCVSQTYLTTGNPTSMAVKESTLGNVVDGEKWNTFLLIFILSLLQNMLHYHNKKHPNLLSAVSQTFLFG